MWEKSQARSPENMLRKEQKSEILFRAQSCLIRIAGNPRSRSTLFMFNIFNEVKENQVHSPPLSWPSLPFFRTISTGMCCSSFLAPRHQAVSLSKDYSLVNLILSSSTVPALLRLHRNTAKRRIVKECILKVMIPYLHFWKVRVTKSTNQPF